MNIPTPESLRDMASKLDGDAYQTAREALLKAAHEIEASPPGLKVHFMYDCHLFASNIDTSTDATLALRIRELFDEDGCGSIFVRDKFDRGVENLTLHGKQLPSGKWGVTDKQIKEWICQFRSAQGKTTINSEKP